MALATQSHLFGCLLTVLHESSLAVSGPTSFQNAPDIFSCLKVQPSSNFRESTEWQSFGQFVPFVSTRWWWVKSLIVSNCSPETYKLLSAETIHLFLPLARHASIYQQTTFCCGSGLRFDLLSMSQFFKNLHSTFFTLMKPCFPLSLENESSLSFSGDYATT